MHDLCDIGSSATAHTFGDEIKQEIIFNILDQIGMDWFGLVWSSMHIFFLLSDLTVPIDFDEPM